VIFIFLFSGSPWARFVAMAPKLISIFQGWLAVYITDMRRKKGTFVYIGTRLYFGASIQSLSAPNRRGHTRLQRASEFTVSFHVIFTT
jgi:hypothetical protein